MTKGNNGNERQPRMNGETFGSILEKTSGYRVGDKISVLTVKSATDRFYLEYTIVGVYDSYLVLNNGLYNICVNRVDLHYKCATVDIR